MKAISSDYEHELRPRLSEKKPMFPFYSSVTGKILGNDHRLGAAYWRANLESEVSFYPAVQDLLARETSAIFLLEIGPHGALAGPLRQTVQSTSLEVAYQAAIIRNQHDSNSLLTAIGKLFLKGVSIDFDAL